MVQTKGVLPAPASYRLKVAVIELSEHSDPAAIGTPLVSFLFVELQSVGFGFDVPPVTAVPSSHLACMSAIK